MDRARFTRASRRYYRNRLTLLGIAGFLASALICANLLVGHSVRESIKAYNLNKIGKATHLIISQTPFINDLEKRIISDSNIEAAAYLQLPLISASGIQNPDSPLSVTGIDTYFLSFFSDDKTPGDSPDEGELWLNKMAADYLDVKPGDPLTLRIAHISTGEIVEPAARGIHGYSDREFTVSRILEESSIASFQTEITQRPSRLIFANRDELGQIARIPGRANRVLIRSDNESFQFPPDILSLEDPGLKLHEDDSKHVVLTSDAHFIPSYIQKALSSLDSEHVHASFLHSAEAKAGSRFYLFFVSSPDKQNIISPLLAQTTGAKPGDTIILKYYKFSEDDGKLTIGEYPVIIDSIGNEALFLKRSSDIPDFPGLDEGASCRDWDSSLPIDFSQITPAIEEDWERHGKRPHIILNTGAAKTISPDPVLIRFEKTITSAMVRNEFSNHVSIDDAGIAVTPIREELVKASRGSVDFAMLFLSMSFFLIAALLFIHAVLAIQFINARKGEAGLLRTTGYSVTKLRKLYTREILLPVLISSITGSLFGIFLVRILLSLLRSIWYGAVNTDALYLFIAPWIVPASFIAGSVPVLLLSAIVIKKRLINFSMRDINLPVPTVSKRNTRILFLLSILLFVAAAILFFTALTYQSLQSTLFFISGLLLLLSLATAAALSFLCREPRDRAVIVVLTISFFIVTAVSANRLVITFDPEQSSSPTGGKHFIINTNIPVPADRIPDREEKMIPFTVFGEESANCLNLNALDTPGILGVDTKLMDAEDIFTLSDGDGKKLKWKTLANLRDDGAIPAAIDASVLQWGLKKNLNNTLIYRGKDGKKRRVVLTALANDTCLQGRIYMDHKLLYSNFNSPSGAGIFLAGTGGSAEERRLLQRLFNDWGAHVRPSTETLREFMHLQNTYLRIFQTLSTLALLLGLAGLALLIRSGNNDDSRRIILMRSLGFSQMALKHVHFIHYSRLLFISAIISLVSVLPVLYPLLATGNIHSALIPILQIYGIIIICGLVIIRIFGLKINHTVTYENL
ncbi:MAG: ABC transporter permease [Spirochaetes bacterium]|nr:ABC transporter permease [Spirochaetota bacterium]